MTLDKKLTCATCGGELVADKERNLYKCEYCGVAYGYGLFDGTAAEKAEKSLSIGEFNDADLYYTFVLSMEPKDITALRGRVFCAGKWKKTSDLMTGKGELTGVRADGVKQRCDEAIKKVSEKDAKYFNVIKDFVDASSIYHDAKAKAAPILKREQRLFDRSLEVDNKVEKMERSYERSRRRNASLTELILNAPNPQAAPDELKSAWDVADIMHNAVTDSGKESKEIQDKIFAYANRRNGLYKKIVEMEKKMFPKE